MVDELFAYWTLEESEDTLEALEDALIVRPALPTTKLGLCVSNQGAPRLCAEDKAARVQHFELGSIPQILT